MFPSGTLKKTNAQSKKNISGNLIRAVRLRANPAITQDDLSGRLAVRGITLGRVAITKIENGQRYVLDYELRAIAAALKVPVTDLLG